MGSEPDNGGPAFPHAAWTEWSDQIGDVVFHDDSSGMSLRDFAAIKAMAAIIGCENAAWGSAHQISPEQVARESYGYADAMIAARKEGSHAD